MPIKNILTLLTSIEPEMIHQQHQEILSPNEKSEELSKHISNIKREIDLFIGRLEHIPVKSAILEWLQEINDTAMRDKYAHSIILLHTNHIIHEFFADGKDFTLGGLRFIRHQAVLASIKKIKNLQEIEQQEHIECYKTFIKYLNKISYGWFGRVAESTNESDFSYQMSPKAAKRTLAVTDWRLFIDYLYEKNHRDSIIARCILRGTKRISEILSLTIDQIDFQNNIIYFAQKTGNGPKSRTAVHYDSEFINEIKEYIEATAAFRSGTTYVFITRNGKPVTRSRLNFSFAQASLEANIKRVTPESLRAISTIFTKQGWKESTIMQNKKARQHSDKHFNQIL